MIRKKDASLTLVPQKETTPESWRSTLSLLLPCALLLGGLWGVLRHILQLSPLLPFLLSLLAVLCALWIGRCRRKTLWIAVFLTLAALLSLAAHRPLQASLGALCNAFAQWITQTHGVYILPFTAAGNPWIATAILSLLSGVLIGVLVQLQSPLWLLLLLPLFFPVAFSHGSCFPALYLLGLLLLLARYASGAGKQLYTAALSILLTAALAAGAVLPLDTAAAKTETGRKFAHFLHHQVYETVENPLPEGDLYHLAPYAPTHDAALEVTMAHWTPLYIRGFTGSVYTPEGWQPTAPAAAAPMAETLYALQKDHFFPATQPAAAAKAAGTPLENTVTVKNVGACRAYTYVPYGAGQLSETGLHPTQLTGEGTASPAADTLQASVFPITDSYLLQSTLAKSGDPAYLQSEAVYHQWVYDTYLHIPQETYDTLRQYVNPDTTAITTTQARVEISHLISRLLTYSEGTLTSPGKADFAAYVLRSNPKGYSVHYATLATLFMRCCGIPARYVEGYVVSPAQAAAMSDGATLTLQQTNSHAWCEFYLDGVGWIPFDATPGYTDILPYELPPDGIPTSEEGGISHLHVAEELPQPDRPLQVEEEPDREGRSHWIYVRGALGVLGLLLLLGLLVMTGRTLLLRRRLQRLQQSFSTPDPRLGAAHILTYTARLLHLLGLPAQNRPLSQQAPEIAQILHSKEDIPKMIALWQEIWFSSHTITEAQRQQALSWLRSVESVWEKDTPPIKRWQLRWLRCQVI